MDTTMNWSTDVSRDGPKAQSAFALFSHPPFARAVGSKVRSMYDKVRNLEVRCLERQARITSKGQITVPREVRRVLGVGPGDRLLFESDRKGIRVRPVRTTSPFAKFKGIGNPGIGSGRKEIIRWVRELRGR